MSFAAFIVARNGSVGLREAATDRRCARPWCLVRGVVRNVCKKHLPIINNPSKRHGLSFVTCFWLCTASREDAREASPSFTVASAAPSWLRASWRVPVGWCSNCTPPVVFRQCRATWRSDGLEGALFRFVASLLLWCFSHGRECVMPQVATLANCGWTVDGLGRAYAARGRGSWTRQA